MQGSQLLGEDAVAAEERQIPAPLVVQPLVEVGQRVGYRHLERAALRLIEGPPKSVLDFRVHGMPEQVAQGVQDVGRAAADSSGDRLHSLDDHAYQ
ncbi:hypothetical protein KZI27_05025 [Curtobacterium sp. TC1]|uniref:hypothetical protein n=1 Tax=Curtobacterium sp. TC1 TaxID=2862880 RepID=UPI001C9A5734|nr:hypothetical protein [Curtobacterium sp. TC1]QZQ56209.1 hypothetical protein KZI27_05025 [Curtobacterium sp. TC1]